MTIPTTKDKAMGWLTFLTLLAQLALLLFVVILAAAVLVSAIYNQVKDVQVARQRELLELRKTYHQ